MRTEAGIIFGYRFVSLLFTSLFFAFGNVEHSLFRKGFVICCLVISSIILTYLYSRVRSSKARTSILVLIETIGNSFLLIPSGGLASPYVWYSLNTILISSFYLGKLHCWSNLAVYLACSTLLTRAFGSSLVAYSDIISSQSNLILSYVLITAIIQLLSAYSKRIEFERARSMELNFQLANANQRIKESLDQTMEMYQIVSLISKQRDEKGLVNLLINYIHRVTGSAVFMSVRLTHDEVIFAGQGLSSGEQEKIRENLDTVSNPSEPEYFVVNNQEYCLVPVASNYRNHGVLGIRKANQWGEEYREQVDQLLFLSKVSSIMLEKFELEQVNASNLINEEQNRIASEIHDSILQRLFSASCGLYNLYKKLGKDTAANLHNDVNAIRVLLNNTMKDLRETIYGLSWHKQGRNKFIDEVHAYINEVRAMHDVIIDLKINGDCLSSMQKTALYRMICETVSNSVRHGKAKRIRISLLPMGNKLCLKISDDGVGFDTEAVNISNKVGIGLKNISNLVHYLNGDIDICSELNRGTSITINIPNQGYREDVV